jgi:hypothetical protein
MPEYMEEFKFPDELEEEAKAAKAAEDSANVEAPESDIEIVDDTPPQDRGREPSDPPPEVTEDELESYDKKVQKRLQKFTKGYHDERRAKEAAVREREEALNAAKFLADENRRLQEQLHEGSKVYIEQAKGGAEAELNVAKRQFKEAYESGDVDAMTAAQQAIATATMKIERAATLRPLQVEEKEVKIPQAQQEAPQQQLDPRTSEWLEDNPWYGEDDEMSATALGLHSKLEKDFGKQYIGSEEYFKKIDATMRKRYPEYFGSETKQETSEEEEKPQTRAKPASNVVAPATRSTAPKKVKLTTTQVAIAKKLGVPLDLYAKKVAEQMNGER